MTREEAIEQEPTAKNDLGVDAVSRKAVLNQIFYSTDNSGDVVLGSALRERIERLPSVTPQEPKSEPVHARWIRQMKSEIADSLEFWDYSPNNNPLARDILETVNTYCAKMVEPQESEDKG